MCRMVYLLPFIAALASPAHATFFFEGLEPFAERHCVEVRPTGQDFGQDFEGPVCPPEPEPRQPKVHDAPKAPGKVVQK
jgi:hypothetical protein